MAKLSVRLDGCVNRTIETLPYEEAVKQFKNSKQTKGEKTMALRTINLTLVDNNSNLKGEGKIVFQKLNYVTEHNDDQSIQQILMSGDVAEDLKKHNIKRSRTVDKGILRNTGRYVTLDEVEIFDLQWMVVQVA